VATNHIQRFVVNIFRFSVTALLFSFGLLIMLLYDCFYFSWAYFSAGLLLCAMPLSPVGLSTYVH